MQLLKKNIKRIEPNNIEEIRTLKKDDICFPIIDYSSNGELDLNSTTLLAAYSIISKRVNEKYISDLEWNVKGDIDWQNKILKELSDNIYKMIDDYQSNPTDFLLEKIFIWIQLWGGNAGRGVFIKGEKWPKNFKLETYRNAIKDINDKEYIEALEIMNSLYGISTAFATKHIHFWSKKDAPIYDSIIAAIIFGRNQSEIRSKEYPAYIKSIEKLSVKLDLKEVSKSTIERNLFNWANTENGINWREIRLG